MKVDTNTLLAGMLIAGAGVYFLTQNNNVQPPIQYPQFPTVPPQPPQQTPQWQQWVTGIISVFGTAAELWQPGGPFYNPGDTFGLVNPEDYSDFA